MIAKTLLYLCSASAGVSTEHRVRRSQASDAAVFRQWCSPILASADIIRDNASVSPFPVYR